MTRWFHCAIEFPGKDSGFRLLIVCMLFHKLSAMTTLSLPCYQELDQGVYGNDKGVDAVQEDTVVDRRAGT